LQLAHLLSLLALFSGLYYSYYFAHAYKGDQEWTFAVTDNGIGLIPSSMNKSSKYSEGCTLEKNTLGQA
jgi:hypothetical protein